MKAKSKKIMGLFLALVMLLGCLPLNTIETYAAPEDVAIDATNFPDENFRKYVKDNFDKNPADDVLSQGELDAVTKIEVSGKNIRNLEGIKYFRYLSKLYCSYNQLTSLDVSKNTSLDFLICFNNQLTSLDVSKNKVLSSLECNNNQLTSLDVSKNPLLGNLECAYNQLTSLDVSNNTELHTLYCAYNQLTSLDVSKNTKLDQLVCFNNQLTSLDVSKNLELNYLNCAYNQLTSLDVSKNPLLDRLDCGRTQLTSLDVSNNTKLKHIFGKDIPLTIVKLPSQNLETITLEPKYVIEVPDKTSVIKFPEGFNPENIVGEPTGLKKTNDGFEWDEQTNISFDYKLCDSPELTVKVTVETKTVSNPAVETAKQLVEKAEKDKTEENYNTAKEAVDALVKGSGKAGLEKKLAAVKDFLDKELKEAKEKAKEEIGKLPNLSDTEKDEYKGKVDNATTKEEVKTAVDEAKAKDEENKTAKDQELKEAKEKAKDEIDKLPNLSDDEKDKYKKQVDDAQTKGDVEKAVEDAKAKDAENKNAADEKNKPATADDKEKAKDEIDKLPNLSDAEKDKYKGDVDNAQTKGDVEKAVEDAKAKDAENKNAADEKNKPATADDKKAAKDEIDKLPNLSDDEKDKYKKQVDDAQTKGDVEKAVEDAKAKDAENKNAADEKNKPATPDDKNKAKDEIDKLPNLSDAEKDKYKKQVDDAQTKGDVAKIVDEAKAKAGVPTPEPSPTPNPSVDRDHDYWYRPYWTYSYGTSNTTKQTPVKTNLVKLESKLVIGSKEMVKSVDGVEQKINMDIAPFIEGNRTMLPIRFVAESLGFNVQWDKESRTVILIDKENVVKIPVDTNQIIVNGKVYESDVKPVIRNNRTMLPIANIARALGLKDGTDIIWNAATKEVKINREIEK